MNKKGFTLVEIMGVVIIMGILALITTPIVSYIIEEIREGAFKSSLNSVVRTTDYYYKQNTYEEFPSTGIEVTNEKIKLKNKNFVSGKVVKDKEGNLYLRNVTDNRYCGNGIITNLRITKGDCSDLTIPENLSITVLEEEINKIKVSGYYEEDGYIRRIEFGIREKGTSEYVWHESIKDGIPHNIYEFIGLKKNTEYEIGLRVTNENDLSAEEYTEAKTLNIENPYITYKKEWEKSKEVSINIPNVESSLKYSYIIVSVGGQVEETEIKQSDINNHIYKVTINKENETMIIKVIDSSNSNNSYTSIGEVIGYIDITNPTIGITSISTPTGSNNWYISSPLITITKSDSKSGLKSYEYAVSTDGGTTYGTSTITTDINNIATITLNASGSNIKIRIRSIDNVNNYSEYVYTNILKIDIGSITAPVITGGSSSWSSTNRTISVSTASTSSSGITKYQYYLSTSSTSQTGGSWLDASGTSQVVSTNGTYYVFFRGVSNSGKTSTASNAQQVRIDNITPTITAKASEYTIVQGTGNALPSAYFNVSTTGASGIASTVCKVGTVTYTNTSNMPGGTHTLTCTTTSGAGKSASASTRVIIINSSDVNKIIDEPGEKEYIVPITGYYKLEVWGAQGGGSESSGGRGAYVGGNVYLIKGDKLYVYVGGSGNSSTNRSFNGGASGQTRGGGATDIRIIGGTWNNEASLNSRLIVAAGGGGGGSEYTSRNGRTYPYTPYSSGGAGTVSTGQAGWNDGTIGAGGAGSYWGSQYYLGGGGGGGWYGGSGARGRSTKAWPAGYGGRSYAFQNGNISNVLPSYSPQSRFIFNNVVMKNGNESMPNPAGGTMTGKTGDGSFKITYVNGTTPSHITALNYTFSYNAGIQTYQVPQTGTYRIKLWGADGAGTTGCDSGQNGSKGLGAYVSGTVNLTKGQILYVYVGESGSLGGDISFNGQQPFISGPWGYSYENAGGGATDIRTYGAAPANLTSLNSRIIVAGGGGTVGQNVACFSSGCRHTCSPGGNATTLSTSKTCANTGDPHNGIFGAGGLGSYYSSSGGVNYEGGGGGGGYCGGSGRGSGSSSGGTGGTSYFSAAFGNKVHLTGVSVPSSSRNGHGLAIIEYVG